MLDNSCEYHGPKKYFDSNPKSVYDVTQWVWHDKQPLLIEPQYPFFGNDIS